MTYHRVTEAPNPEPIFCAACGKELIKIYEGVFTSSDYDRVTGKKRLSRVMRYRCEKHRMYFGADSLVEDHDDLIYEWPIVESEVDKAEHISSSPFRDIRSIGYG